MSPITSTPEVPEEPQNRRDAEISLLQAMYPDNIQWNQKREELTYKTEQGDTLVLRIPCEYPETARPVLVTASSKDKTDLRDLTQIKFKELHLQSDEEALDSMLQAFEDITVEHTATVATSETPGANTANDPRTNSNSCKTVIIWLHHLLNTNKRKLALNPNLAPETVSGITKPGYPGVLLYSGDEAAVNAHCSELRNQRWQAFQVRFEESGQQPWTFSHGAGILEVESMSQATQDIAEPANREAFLRAIGVK